MKSWTQEEIDILMENYNKVSNSDLELLLPAKSFSGIYKKAYKLGLRKTRECERVNRSKAKGGPNAYNWRGGVMVNKKGYRLVKCAGHHRADKRGYVMEHILVWEKATGIEVPPSCCVHHLNGVKDDNRPENLCLMEFGAHTSYHHAGRHLSTETRQKISERRRGNVC